MDDKTLKKLKRAQLLEMLLEQSKEVERLKAELQKAKAALKNREIKIENSGSIADAALQLNGVFEAAQNAANQYMENIERLSANQDAIIQEKEEAFKKKMKHMLMETKEKCDAIEKASEEKVVEAELQIEEKWHELEMRWEKFCAARTDMQDVVRDLQRGNLKNDQAAEQNQ